jgi:hypothetical protein
LCKRLQKKSYLIYIQSVKNIFSGRGVFYQRQFIAFRNTFIREKACFSETMLYCLIKLAVLFFLHFAICILRKVTWGNRKGIWEDENNKPAPLLKSWDRGATTPIPTF